MTDTATIKESWLERMVVESQELEDKIDKLESYLATSTPGVSHQMGALLIRQLGIMHLYASVLQERYALHMQERGND